MRTGLPGFLRLLSRQALYAVFCIALTALFVASLMAERLQTGLVLMTPALLVGGIVVIAACHARPWALKLCLFAYIVTIDASLRESSTIGPAPTMDSQIMVKIAISSAILVVGLANLRDSIRYYGSLPGIALLAYLALAILSTLYAPSPMSTLQNAGSFVAVLLFAGALAARLQFREILVTSVLALGIHVVLAVVLMATNATPLIWMVTGDGGIVVRLKGLTGHALRFAEMSALFMLCAWVMWHRGWLSIRTLLVVAAFGGVALLLTKERMPIIAFSIALLSLGRFRMASVAGLMGLSLAGLIAVTVNPGLMTDLAGAISRSGNPQEVLNLSGRLDIWSNAIDVFLERPFLGHGFASAAQVLPQQKNPLMAHTGAEGVFTQSLVATGLIGTALLAVCFGCLLVFAVRYRDSALNPLITYSILSGLTTSSTIGSSPNVLTVFWMIALCLTSTKAESRADAALIAGKAQAVSATPEADALAGLPDGSTTFARPPFSDARVGWRQHRVERSVR